MLRKMILTSCVALAVASSGCAGLNEQYVTSDRATYAAIAPEYVIYVMKDPKLDDDQKEIRLNTILSWKAKLDEAEKQLRSSENQTRRVGGIVGRLRGER